MPHYSLIIYDFFFSDPVNWDENSKKENEEAEENLRKEVIKELRKTVNHWKPLVYAVIFISTNSISLYFKTQQSNGIYC